ncbi:MAG: PEP-CTERM sorting domain-containing protein [Planctomycetes bacterium]|nr:PEP-CTERM sorting domain-containing protein [Planctomycetota bacterium]
MFQKIGFVALGVMVLGAASNSYAGFTYYTDRATFDAAHPGFAIEDFENGNTGTSTLMGVPAPVNSASDNSVFSPGDVMPGFSIFPTGPNSDTPLPLGLTTSNYRNFTSQALGTFNGGSSLDILFDGEGVWAVGMDIFSVFGDSSFTITLLRPNAPPLDSISVPVLADYDGPPTFFGVDSDPQEILGIRFFSTGNRLEFVDNIALVPEPTTLILLACGALGVLRRLTIVD